MGKRKQKLDVDALMKSWQAVADHVVNDIELLKDDHRKKRILKAIDFICKSIFPAISSGDENIVEAKLFEYLSIHIIDSETLQADFIAMHLLSSLVDVGYALMPVEGGMRMRFIGTKEFGTGDPMFVVNDGVIKHNVNLKIRDSVSTAMFDSFFKPGEPVGKA